MINGVAAFVPSVSRISSSILNVKNSVKQRICPNYHIQARVCFTSKKVEDI